MSSNLKQKKKKRQKLTLEDAARISLRRRNRVNTPTNEHSQPPGVSPVSSGVAIRATTPEATHPPKGRSTMDSCQVPRHYFFFHHRFPFFTCAMLPKPRVLQHRGRHANVMIIEEESGDPTGVNFEHADETYPPPAPPNAASHRSASGKVAFVIVTPNSFRFVNDQRR